MGRSQAHGPKRPGADSLPERFDQGVVVLFQPGGANQQGNARALRSGIADIVMGKGGPGEGSITCEVNLENIVRSRRQPPGLDTLGSPSGLEGNDGKQAIHGVLSPLSPTGETHGHSTQFHQ